MENGNLVSMVTTSSSSTFGCVFMLLIVDVYSKSRSDCLYCINLFEMPSSVFELFVHVSVCFDVGFCVCCNVWMVASHDAQRLWSNSGTTDSNRRYIMVTFNYRSIDVSMLPNNMHWDIRCCFFFIQIQSRGVHQWLHMCSSKCSE